MLDRGVGQINGDRVADRRGGRMSSVRSSSVATNCARICPVLVTFVSVPDASATATALPSSPKKNGLE